VEKKVKVVGKRSIPETHEEFFRRGQRLRRSADKLNPFPRPRGFVVKFKTHDDYERWKREQSNPRLW
jgi:hypothetical protein